MNQYRKVILTVGALLIVVFILIVPNRGETHYRSASGDDMLVVPRYFPILGDSIAVIKNDTLYLRVRERRKSLFILSVDDTNWNESSVMIFQHEHPMLAAKLPATLAKDGGIPWIDERGQAIPGDLLKEWQEQLAEQSEQP